MHACLCRPNKKHIQTLINYQRLETALTRLSPKDKLKIVLNLDNRKKIQDRLNLPKQANLRKQLNAKRTQEGSVNTYPRSIVATVINLLDLTNSIKKGAYRIALTTYKLLRCTIFNRGSAVYLVNNIDLIEPRIFIKNNYYKTVNARD